MVTQSVKCLPLPPAQLRVPESLNLISPAQAPCWEGSLLLPLSATPPASERPALALALSL